MTARTPSFPPADLDTVPAVDALLSRLGLGAFDRATVGSPVGRNDVWTGRTTGGAGVFVKRLHGPNADVRTGLRRTVAFEDFRTRVELSGLAAPTPLSTDPGHHLVAFKLIEDATSGLQMVVEDTFTDADGHRAGAAVAALHGGIPPAGAGIECLPPAAPELELMAALPVAAVQQFSAAEMDVWRLLQRDTALAAALRSVREEERAAPTVPVHNDLRIDQLLFVGGVPSLTDWEEFRLGDGARDVGAFAGEWLHRAVLEIVTSSGDLPATLLDGTLDPETVLSRGVAKIQRLRPRVQHFWAAYTAVRSELDPGFARRAAAVAGWHLLDRLLAAGHRRSRLSGSSAPRRASAGAYCWTRSGSRP